MEQKFKSSITLNLIKLIIWIIVSCLLWVIIFSIVSPEEAEKRFLNLETMKKGELTGMVSAEDFNSALTNKSICVTISGQTTI